MNQFRKVVAGRLEIVVCEIMFVLILMAIFISGCAFTNMLASIVIPSRRSRSGFVFFFF